MCHFLFSKENMATNGQLNYLVILSSLLATTYAIYLYHDNKQICHCQSGGPCNQNGICTPDECKQPYIGVTCQHASFGWFMLSKEIKTITAPPLLLDGKDATCVTTPIAVPAIFEVSNPLHVFWIYISSESTISTNPYLTVYKNGSNLSINSTILQINEKSLLLKPTEDIVYDKLELINLPNDSCSLEISLGRNLAVSSTPTQSSELVTSREAKLAIDDSYATYTHTNKGKNEWWKTRLLHDAFVNIIHMYFGGPVFNYCTMIKIALKLFKSDNIEVYDSNLDVQMRRSPVRVGINVVGREVKASVSAKGQPSQCLVNGKISFILSEMYIFGEFRCPANMHGPLCEKYCPGCSRDFCDPDWGCPQGCKEGWTGHWCDTNCMFRYGEQCQLMCPEQCGGIGDCDRSNGVCLEGCKVGFLPPHCTDLCPPGTFDVNCSRSCFNCKMNASTGIPACDSEIGTCLIGCAEGYGGDNCEKMKTNYDTLDLLKYPLGGVGFICFVIMSYKCITNSKKYEEYVNKQDKEKEKIEVEQKRVEAVVVKIGAGPSTDPDRLLSESSWDEDISSNESYTEISSDESSIG